MKYLLFSMILLVSLRGYSQETDQQMAQAAFDKLMLSCQPDSFELQAKLPHLLAYNGDDMNRKWKETCDASSIDDYQYVNQVMQRIQAMMATDPNYHIVNYVKERMGKSDWYSFDVRYNEEGVEKKLLFTFIKLDDKMVLADITN